MFGGVYSPLHLLLGACHRTDAPRRFDRGSMDAIIDEPLTDLTARISH